MSETMVERVARAIFAVSAPYVDHCCNDPDFDLCPCRENAMLQARAAIEAFPPGQDELLEMAKRVDADPEARRSYISMFNAADVAHVRNAAMARFIGAVFRAALKNEMDEAP